MTSASPHARPRNRSLTTVLVVVLAAVLAATLLPAALGPLPSQGAPPEERAVPRQPNIVVVMADDMRADDLQFAPRTSRLVGERGLTFANSFSPYPLCCPARSSYLSGRYAHGHGVLDNKAPYGYRAFDDSRTIATSLSRAGYRTGYVGKYLNGYGKADSLVTGRPSLGYVPRGYDDWRATTQYPDGARADGRRLRGSPYHYFTSPFTINGDVDTSTYGRYQSDVVGAYARQMATRSSRRERPFYLHVNFLAPHTGGPREPDDPTLRAEVDERDEGFSTPARPDRVKGAYDDLVRRPSGLPRDGGPAEADVSDKPSFFRRLPELSAEEREALTTVTRQRAESILVMDQQVGRLVEKLKRLGEWRDTVFVFTSDNGFFLGEHRQRSGKIRSHEPSIRVPFLLTGPGLRGGETRYDPISTVDVTATLLDLAGARPPGPQDGRSLWETVVDGDQGWVRPVGTEAVRALEPQLPDPPVEPGEPVKPGGEARAAGAAPLRLRPPLPLDERPDAAARRTAQRDFGEGEERDSIGVRTARWSYTRYANGEGELYDLLTDPAQLENVYDDPAYAEVQALLEDERARLADCVGAACLDPLDPALQADAEQNRAWTEAYWSAIEARYAHVAE